MYTFRGENKILRGLALSLSLILLSLVSGAQKIGIRVGLNSSNLGEYEYYGQTLEFKNLIGFNSGIVTEFPRKPIMNIFSLEFGLGISTKGTKEIQIYDYVTGQHTYYSRTDTYIRKLSFFELPINIKSSFKIKNVHIFFTTGPYFAYGINGNIDFKCTSTESGIIIYSEKYKVNWALGEIADYKRLDYGLSFGLGIEKRPIEFSISINRGIRKIHQSFWIESYTKDYILTYNGSVVYFFGKKNP